MEDVVFNGTDKRKRQGYAEVTLNIDNKDRPDSEPSSESPTADGSALPSAGPRR